MSTPLRSLEDALRATGRRKSAYRTLAERATEYMVLRLEYNKRRADAHLLLYIRDNCYRILDI